MLPKINRLQKQKDIERVLKKGKDIKEDFLVLKTVKNNLNESRFGFLVSKKISKKANIRNKIKRRLRELIMIRLKKIKIGTDNLIITLPGLEKKDFREIEEKIVRLFKKAKILNNNQ